MSLRKERYLMPFLRVLLIAISLIAAAIPGKLYADIYDSLFEEFDARPLRNDEKVFLQGALSLQGYYQGLLDGAWGRQSQSAIERYSAEIYDNVPLNVHIAPLVLDFDESNEDEDWTTNYLAEFGVSLILPARNLRLIKREPGYLYWEHTSNSLNISISDMTQGQMVALHQDIRQSISYLREPYTIQYSNRWVTSISHKSGNLVYIRSDLIGDQWSTVFIATEPHDANSLNFISTSISIGRVNEFRLPLDGEIERLFKLAFSYVEDSENSTRQQEDSTANEPFDANPVGATGTGFFIDTEGSVLTNAHVIDNCKSLTVGTVPYLIASKSDDFDLALLLPLNPSSKQSFASFASRPAKLNADVTVAGFPLPEILSGLNVTRGAVTALSGLGGGSLQMQISAPVQPGNSGGPVLDKSGNVIGVVVAKLDSLRVAEAVGDIPQNVNFAIRGEIAKLFLGSIGADYTISTESDRLEPIIIADRAADFTVLVECR